MRAKTINEDVHSVLKPKSSQEIQTAKSKHLDDLLTKLSSAIYLIRYAAQDYQFDKDGEAYLGFINVGLDIVNDPILQQSIRDFVNLWHSNYNEILRIMLNDIGLEIDGGVVDEDEIVFTEK